MGPDRGAGELIGRDVELELLKGAINARRPVLAVGEPGIGKTALLRAAARAAGGRVYEGGALGLLSHVPLLALRRALRCELPPGDAAALAEFAEVMVGDAVLVLDDLQWADAGTREVATLLAGRVRLLAATRGEPALDGFEIVRLGPLGHGPAAALVRRSAPELRGAQVRRVVARANGSPLLLEELARAPAGSSTLRMAVSAQLAELPTAQREAVDRLALLERPVAAASVGADAQILGASGLVSRTPDGLVLRHALIGEVAREAMADSDRRRLHRELTGIADGPGEAARHLLAAGDRAAARGAALLAVEGAARQDDRAMLLALAASCTDGAGGDELRVHAAEEAVHAGAYPDALRILEAVSAVRGPLAARAALAQAEALMEVGRMDDAAHALERGAVIDDPGPEFTARLELARIRQRVWGWDTGLVDAAEAAWAAADAAGWGAPRDLVAVGLAHLVALSPDAPARLLAARERAREAGDAPAEAEALGAASGALLNQGRTAEAYELVLEGEALLRRLGLGRRLLGVLQIRVNLELWARGDYAATLRLTESLLERGHLLGVAGDSVVGHRAIALADTGRIDDAHELLTTALARPRTADGEAVKQWIRSEIYWLEGRAEEAGRAATAVIEGPETPYQGLAECVAAWAAVDRGLPVSSTRDVPGTHTEAVMCREQIRAVADLASGRWTDARAGFAAAAEAAAGVSVREQLRARWGGALAALGADDRAGARADLLAVEEEIAARGMLALLPRVHGALRRAGVRRSAGAAPSEGLTGREREVIALVGTGLTSAQIASRLGIERSTVETHVRAAMRKFGSRTRVQAAAALRAART